MARQTDTTSNVMETMETDVFLSPQSKFRELGFTTVPILNDNDGNGSNGGSNGSFGSNALQWSLDAFFKYVIGHKKRGSKEITYGPWTAGFLSLNPSENDNLPWFATRTDEDFRWKKTREEKFPNGFQIER